MEGFLSGFTGHEVKLGHDCLDLQWAERVEKLTETVWKGIVESNYTSAMLSGMQLYSEIENELKDCHY